MFDDITGHIWYVYWLDLVILYFFPGSSWLVNAKTACNSAVIRDIVSSRAFTNFGLVVGF